MEEEYSGKILRLMINNHSKNKITKREEIKALIGLENKEIDFYIEKCQIYANNIHLEIVAPSDTGNINIKGAKKLFLRKYSDQNYIISDNPVNDDDRRLFLIFIALQIEDGILNEEKMKHLLRTRIFKDVSLEDFLKKNKNIGYLSSRCFDNEVTWHYGWKFYVEYHENFNFIDYFNEEGIEVGKSSLIY